MWTLAPEPATDPVGQGRPSSGRWGPEGVVSDGLKAHSEAVLTKVEYGATRPGW